MGCLYSKPIVHARDNSTSINYCLSELRSYYHELQSLDAILRHPTRGVAADHHSSSFNSPISEVSGTLSDHDHEVVNDTIIIPELKEEISNNPHLLGFVRDYLKYNIQVLSFFTILKKARQNHAIVVHNTLQLFKEGDDEGVENNNKSMLLEKFKEFEKAAESFIDSLRSVCDKQKSMLDVMHPHKSKLRLKLGSLKAWKKVSGAIFWMILATVLISSVVLAAVAAPQAAIATATAASSAVGPMKEWFGSLLAGHEVALREQKDAITKIYNGTLLGIRELDSILILLQDLRNSIGLQLWNAETDISAEAAKVAIEDTMENMGVFLKHVDYIEKEVDACINNIREAAAMIVHTLTAEK